MRVIVLVVITFVLNGCWFSGHEQKLQGGYLLSILDSREDQSLMVLDDGYMINVVPPTVVGYISNAHFIGVKRKPENLAGSNFEYYIIPIIEKVSLTPYKNVIGPLSYEDFTDEVTKYKGEPPYDFIDPEIN